MNFYNVSRTLMKLLYSGSFIMLLINIDRLGNALSGGSYTSTVSGRVGRLVITSAHPFWRFVSAVIDKTFAPIDGPDHCYRAFIFESKKPDAILHRRGSDVGIALLSVLSVVICALLFPIIKLIALFKGDKS